MFEVTIRTDNQAAFEQLLDFLKGLDLKMFKAPVLNEKNLSIELTPNQPDESGLPSKEGFPNKKSGEKGEIPAVSFQEWAGVKPDPEKYKPGFGGAKGMFVMSPDFDEPLEDFKEYMY